jgi:hypothetical protein
MNPAGLLDKVSLGVFEMARDPIVGITEGPGGFVKGVGSGVQGLVKGVVGGAFSSLGKFAGAANSVLDGGQEGGHKKAQDLGDGLIKAG